MKTYTITRVFTKLLVVAGLLAVLWGASVISSLGAA